MKKAIQNLKLHVDFIKEGETFVAYSPALDLSTCGDTFEEAQKNFEEIVRIFFGELVKMGTLEEVLSSLGWRRSKKLWTPPTVIASQLQSFTVPAFA